MVYNVSGLNISQNFILQSFIFILGTLAFFYIMSDNECPFGFNDHRCVITVSQGTNVHTEFTTFNVSQVTSLTLLE